MSSNEGCFSETLWISCLLWLWLGSANTTHNNSTDGNICLNSKLFRELSSDQICSSLKQQKHGFFACLCLTAGPPSPSPGQDQGPSSILCPLIINRLFLPRDSSSAVCCSWPDQLIPESTRFCPRSYRRKLEKYPRRGPGGILITIGH